MAGSHAKSHVSLYVTIYVSLLVLVGVTVGVAHVKTGPLAFPIAMAVAGFKTFLIVAIFMHLKDEFPLIRVFAGASVFWLALMFTFIMTDYLTRNRTSTINMAVEQGIPTQDAERPGQ
ncbi:cytochrome C oxidase subunit IV family protein [Planctomicrobium sp. SH661]|uniref:cytochrome C oxidase subunit IV family protein n=1 Tax=Planctomicrobium sp. SH661 TaxID=3448124 RepID=UPI003F5CA554